MGGGARGRIPGNEDHISLGNRPNGIYVPRFRNVKQKHPLFLRGYGFQGSAARPKWERGTEMRGFGAEFKHTISRPGPWIMTFGGFGECLPNHENFIELDKTKVDAWGIPVLRISCVWRENERALLKDMSITAAEMLSAAGARDIEPYIEDNAPGLTIHEMGTARMGRDPKTSVLNAHNQAHDANNLFITDGACMASSSCVNPSLTYMALTARACDYAVSSNEARRNLMRTDEGMDRRTFLGTMTAATVLSRNLAWAAGDHKIDKVGLQLYTIRSVMKDDFEGKLAKVSAIGYREVEFAGYDGHTPQEVRAMLDRHGLTGPSAHIPYKSLGAEFPSVLDAAHVVGHKYLVNPYIDDDVRKGPDGWKRAAETFNRAGEASQKAGIQFAYHNHWFEFAPVNGKLPYDILLEECDPKLVKMEMDLCWIMVGGQDPFKYFNRYPGRFPLVHVKDLTKIPKTDATGGQNFGDSLDEMTEVGSGIIEWKKIFAQSEKAGIKHYFVEHDHPKDPFASVTTSYEYLSKVRF